MTISMHLTTMQCSWHSFTQYPRLIDSVHPIKASGIPLETSFVNTTPPQYDTKLKIFSQGIFSLEGYRIAASSRRRRQGLIAVTGSLEREDAVMRSGTKARERRLKKLKKEKWRREIEKERKLREYPEWARVLEEGCKYDKELREIIGDAIGNPDLIRKRILQSGKRFGRDVQKPRPGSVLAVNVVFRDFNPIDFYIWIELYGSPSDKEIDFIGTTIQSWYVIGRLGGFNSTNLQLTQSERNATLRRYNVDQTSKALTSSLHDISDVEFQDNLARFWVDMGTSDIFALDVLINALMGVSADFVGIKHLVFGGKRFGDWEEGMKSAEFGYKKYKI